jgi:hypothetical protein
MTSFLMESNSSKNKTFICEICGFFIMSMNNLKTHLKEHNIDNFDGNNNNLENKSNGTSKSFIDLGKSSRNDVNNGEGITLAKIKTEINNCKNFNDNLVNEDQASKLAFEES